MALASFQKLYSERPLHYVVLHCVIALKVGASHCKPADYLVPSSHRCFQPTCNLCWSPTFSCSVLSMAFFAHLCPLPPSPPPLHPPSAFWLPTICMLHTCQHLFGFAVKQALHQSYAVLFLPYVATSAVPVCQPVLQKCIMLTSSARRLLQWPSSARSLLQWLFNTSFGPRVAQLAVSAALTGLWWCAGQMAAMKLPVCALPSST